METGRIVAVERDENAVRFVLEDGVRCQMLQRVVSWFRLEVGQLVEVWGVERGGVFVVEEVLLLDDAPAPGFVPRYGRAGAVARIVADVWGWVTGK